MLYKGTALYFDSKKAVGQATSVDVSITLTPGTYILCAIASSSGSTGYQKTYISFGGTTIQENWGQSEWHSIETITENKTLRAWTGAQQGNSAYVIAYSI